MIKGKILTGKYPSACITFVIGKYELSIANDTSCNEDGVIRRSSMCIFDDQINVTSAFYEENEIFGVDADTVFKAMVELRALDQTKSPHI